jgi:hypothetical protein
MLSRELRRIVVRVAACIGCRDGRGKAAVVCRAARLILDARPVGKGTPGDRHKGIQLHRKPFVTAVLGHIRHAGRNPDRAFLDLIGRPSPLSVRHLLPLLHQSWRSDFSFVGVARELLSRGWPSWGQGGPTWFLQRPNGLKIQKRQTVVRAPTVRQHGRLT